MSIDDMEEKFQLHLKLQEAHARITQLEGELVHLQLLLASTTDLLSDTKVDKIIVSTEQTIAEMQLERLKKAAMDRDLTLEETKRYDLLVKNLTLSKASGAAKPADFRALGDISEAQLVQIAAVPEAQPEAD